ncbi:TetR family transcriptional regulator [Mycobacterium dioxanotrophicus]|uniref:TetR family transcriptional regulator n=1 Tax=Mycobacterium dioxanotrophicus TaxID=482462 RepID=A0A1Y0CFN1_9MYCO|nr:TetR family transcriptional regulator [Mycobacterium dioxanotrophicus]
MATVTCLHDAYGRRAHTCRRVFGAAAQLLEGDADVSVSRLAAQAQMAPATLRAHFPSLEVVFAELYLHRVTTLPLDIDPDIGIADRVSDQLTAMTLLLADEPRLARMCTRVLVSTDDDAIADVRSRISDEVRRRISTALGTGAWPEVLATLESVFWGALLQAQTGPMTYRQAARQLQTMVALIVPQAGVDTCPR